MDESMASTMKKLNLALIVLGLLAVIAVSFSVYFYQQNNQLLTDITTKNKRIVDLQKKQTTQITPTSSSVAGNDQSTQTSQPEIPSDWIWCSDKDLGFKFAHPIDWQYVDVRVGTQSAQASDFNSGVCSVPGSMSPKAQIDYLTKKYSNSSQPLVTYSILPKNDSYNTIDSLYEMYKTTYVSQGGYTPHPSSLLTIHGLSGFYINQITNSYSDNIYVIELGAGKFLEFSNRESDKHYKPSPPPTIDDQNDYTQYTSIIDKIVKTLRLLSA